MKTVFTSLTGFATLLSLLTSAQAASNSTDGPSCGVAKTDDSYFSVVGVQGTGVHPRQELRELEKDTDLWNIFLQAFARFQSMDQNEKVSYYQVAGQSHCSTRGRQLANTIQGYTECPSSSGITSPEHQVMK
jgi:tyrosinase